MGIKAKNPYDRIREIRKENRGNPNYPRLRKINDNLIEVTIGKNQYELSPEEALTKFKDVPFFTEEYETLTFQVDDLVSLNLKILDEQLKSKFE